jgi:hypothetical protein
VIKAQQRARIEVVAASAALVLAVAACGSSSKSRSSASQPRSSSSQSAKGAKPRFRATLVGQDHAPVATKRWRYTVRVVSAAGRPLGGTVETEFAFGGQVVGRESPPSHTLKHGVLKDVVEWPKQAIGQPLALQVVVHTSAGAQTLDWPVMVKP